MPDRYAVIGQPVGHSKSPFIHAAFARQTGQDLTYERVEGRDADFEAQVLALAEGGLRGLNVTLPFKERALALAPPEARQPAAALAGAANTLWFADGTVHADNTDGSGLLQDLQGRLALRLAGLRILLLGAGGAARGILAPLAQGNPVCLHVCNRTPARAGRLVEEIAELLPAAPSDLRAVSPDGLAGQSPYDLVLNATSAGLAGEGSDLPAGLFAPGALAYDLAYRADGPTPFMQQARAAGVVRVHDGLGMLVEQAADAFLRWRGIRPQTAPVLAALRS